MFCIILIITLLTICQAQEVSRIDFSFPFQRNIQERYVDVCGNKLWECKDCNTLLFCDKPGSAGIDVDCKMKDPSKPYCNEETKTCQAESTCVSTVIPFNCKYNGYFPDPMHCNKYVYCDKDLKAYSYECPPKSKFDAAKRICTTASIPCTTFSTIDGLCKGKPFKMVAHPSDPSLFAFCLLGGPVSLMSCPNKNQAIDLQNEVCKFYCKEEGFFPNVNKPEQFYICIKDGTTYKAEIGSCAPNSKFNEGSQGCELSNDDNAVTNPPE